MGRCYRRGFDLSPFFAYIDFISSPGDVITVVNKGRTVEITLDDEGTYRYVAIRNGLHTATSRDQGSVDTFDIEVKGQTYRMKLILNTHEVLGQYPHYILDQFTHLELREVILDDEISAACENFTHYTCNDLQGIYMSHLSNFGMRKVG